jgi:hypothetical protein
LQISEVHAASRREIGVVQYVMGGPEFALFVLVFEFGNFLSHSPLSFPYAGVWASRSSRFIVDFQLLPHYIVRFPRPLDLGQSSR